MNLRNLINNILNEDSDFVKVLDFNSNQDYFVFYKDETGKQRKFLKNDIRVRVEVEK